MDESLGETSELMKKNVLKLLFNEEKDVDLWIKEELKKHKVPEIIIQQQNKHKNTVDIIYDNYNNDLNQAGRKYNSVCKESKCY